MDLKTSVDVLTRQAALAADYAMIVAVIALAIFCFSVLYKAHLAEQLRKIGEQHDNLQMQYFNPDQQIVVRRPDETGSDATTERALHPWRRRQRQT